jgi:hypothetical protein
MIRNARPLLLAGAAAAALTAPATPAGASPSLLGISISGPVTLTNFAPGRTATGAGTVTIIATGPWVLRLQDLNPATPGHLRRSTGTGGAVSLTNALEWTTTATLGTGSSGTLSGASTVAASGPLSSIVSVGYTQRIGGAEKLVSGNVYSLSVTWTLSAT